MHFSIKFKIYEIIKLRFVCIFLIFATYYENTHMNLQILEIGKNDKVLFIYFIYLTIRLPTETLMTNPVTGSHAFTIKNNLQSS